MSKISIKIVDHSGEVLAALKERTKVALEAVGAQCEKYAKKECPVDTGFLRNSITYAVSGGGAAVGQYKANKPRSGSKKVMTGSYQGVVGKGADNAVYIGSNVKYAVTVEYGNASHKVGKKHFLRDAAANHTDHYKAIIEACLKASQT